MNLFFQQLGNGIALGSIYSLVALGLTLVYGVLHIPNFAHGALYMAGAYVTYVLVTSLGVPYFAAIPVSAAALALIAAGMERLTFRPLAGRTPLHYMIVSLGVLFVFEGIADMIWGAQFRRLPSPLEGVLNLWGVTLTHHRLLVIAAAVATMIGLFYFLKRTYMGMTIEALAQDQEGALLVGIDTRRVSMLTLAISGALAAVAGSLIAPIVLVFPYMGELIILKAFVIVILGGMGSIPGAIVGGYVLALAETLGGTYITFAFADFIAFALLVLVLALKPTGLFAKGV